MAALIGIGVSALVVVTVRAMDVTSGREQITEATDRMLNHIRGRNFPHPLARSGDEEIQVLNPAGQVVTSTPKLSGRPAMAGFRPPAHRMREKRTLCPPAGLRGCMTVAAYKVVQQEGTWLVYIAIPAAPWYANPILAVFLVLVTLLITATMGAVTYRAVGRTLAPVDAIRAELSEITANHLDRRVPVPENQEEFKALADTANSTLDRLQAAYEQLRRFTSDASHEVRSPLTAIRAQVEGALMYPDETDWPATGQAVLAGVERLQALMGELLDLARLDAGESIPCAPADLAQIVEAEVDRRPHRVRIVKHLQKGVIVTCDRMRMSRLLMNLFDNAERHAISEISLVVREEASTAVLEVIDDGPGIAGDLREIVFRRFTRLDTARNRDAGGSGLGLAIARKIAEVHGGTLTIEDSENGGRFVLHLPRYRPAA
ncbi:HAMP domain-containing histidine kinase [Planotetraspora sp. A-T 1434]|uniref:sensor histidine kinase n=1 Tax=Planotetraspora sp. A-T 1434 TaxID=2979219 RepID=UPI0021BF0FC2|nr:HAMP domain-containing sensor histidine kinase [Planotetraspora sp. A-T 1434]MCT9929637.1 HAMP domain-containing histidine kinase [Planotetraspora sp. A-T 1434]